MNIIEATVSYLGESKETLKESLSAPMSKTDQDTFNSMVIGQVISGSSGSPMCFYKDSTSAMTISGGNFLQLWDVSKRQVLSVYMNDRNVQFLKKALR